MALCVAAYGFLVSERSLIPPSDDKTLVIKTSRLSNGFRPRGSPDPSRHVKSSITSIRIRLARSIARRLPRCPCCQRANL
jgi:hypothetical protein